MVRFRLIRRFLCPVLILGWCGAAERPEARPTPPYRSSSSDLDPRYRTGVGPYPRSDSGLSTRSGSTLSSQGTMSMGRSPSQSSSISRGSSSRSVSTQTFQPAGKSFYNDSLGLALDARVTLLPPGQSKERDVAGYQGRAQQVQGFTGSSTAPGGNDPDGFHLGQVTLKAEKWLKSSEAVLESTKAYVENILKYEEGAKDSRRALAKLHQLAFKDLQTLLATASTEHVKAWGLLNEPFYAPAGDDKFTLNRLPDSNWERLFIKPERSP